MKQQDGVGRGNSQPRLAAITISRRVRPSPTVPFVWNRKRQSRFPFGSDNESTGRYRKTRPRKIEQPDRMLEAFGLRLSMSWTSGPQVRRWKR